MLQIVTQNKCTPTPVDRKPSLLAVTSEPPWPLNSGGHLRTFHLLRKLANHRRVRLVTSVAPGQESALEALRENGIEVCPAFVGPRAHWRELIRAAAAAARKEPYVLYRRHDRPAMREVLNAECRSERPDIVYLDHLDSWVFRPCFGSTPCVVDLHNVYSLIARREGQEQVHWSRRLYLQREARLLERMERQAARNADALFAVSEEEGRYFAGLGARRVHIVPNGVDCAAYEMMPIGRPPGRPTILYIGAMSWRPNAAAAYYLADHVLPRIRERFPAARVQLIGRDPPAELRALHGRPGVEVLGGVPDVKTFLLDAQVLAVPLETAGGTRLKILEAFAAGIPTVSTPIGCEGLHCDHGEHLWIAQRETFAEGIAEVLANQSLASALARRARALVQEQYDWAKVGEVACVGIDGLLRSSVWRAV